MGLGRCRRLPGRGTQDVTFINPKDGWLLGDNLQSHASLWRTATAAHGGRSFPIPTRTATAPTAKRGTATSAPTRPEDIALVQSYRCRMRRIAVLVCAVAVLLAVADAGCASTAPRGRVTGLIRVCGGPAPGRCRSDDGTAYVLGARRRVLATQETRHARFSFLMPPGRYTLAAMADGMRDQRSIIVKADVVLHANIVFSGVS
jgi:hypothetical protein